MRHSSCRTTLDVYTRAVDQQKREASLKVVSLMLPWDVEKFQHPSAPSDARKTTRRCRQIAVKEERVDLLGIEPMTSSMPFFDPSFPGRDREKAPGQVLTPTLLDRFLQPAAKKAGIAKWVGQWRRRQSGARVDAPRQHLHDDEHLYKGFDASQAGGSKSGGRRSSGSIEESRGGCSRRTNVPKAYRIFPSNPLSCWFDWWT
jgi:hypothetical protein